MTSWIKRGDAVTAWSFVSFIPFDLFHSPSISRLGMITEAGFNPKHGNGNRYLWCSVFMNNYQFIRAQIQIDDIHSMIQESLTCLPQDYIFFWCPITNTGIKWCKTRQSLCNGALHYGGVTYSPQLVCVLGVSSRLQLRSDSREDSSEGQMSVLLT